MPLQHPAGRERFGQPRFAWIALGAVVFIVYGSLYPFAFRPFPGDPLRALLATWGARASRGDLAGNVALYVPLGFFVSLAARRLGFAGRSALAAASGTALSIAVELAQLWTSGRQSALSDVIANAAGALFGGVAGAAMWRRGNTRRFAIGGFPLYPALVAACWLGHRLFPFVPTLDLHKYWHAVRPLVAAPAPAPAAVLRHAAAWLAVALLLEAIAGARRGTWALLALVPGVLGARVLIAGVTLSPGEVAGAGAAALLWTLWLSRAGRRELAIALLFTASIVVEALAPYRWSSQPHAFTWLPFDGFLRSSVASSVPSFLEKIFHYGALPWLWIRAGVHPAAAAVGAAVLVLGLRRAQMWLPGRSAEISDGLMVLLMAGLARFLGPAPRRD
jgi:VanZ family protein